MTTERFDRRLAAWLEQDAAGRVPDHHAEVLVATRATRQRPWWSSPERWLPVDVPLQLRLAAAPAPRLLVLLLVLLIAALLAVWVVGQQPRFPLYGPARNGITIRDDGHDLFRVDPVSGTMTSIVAGPDDEFAPYFAPDGSRFVFGRQTADGLFLAIADASGANVKTVAGPVLGFESLDWSGDARFLALVAQEGDGFSKETTLTVIDTRSQTSRHLDLGRMIPSSVGWLPPLGAEIVFRGQGVTRDSAAVFAIKPDGSGLRALTPGGQNDAGYLVPIVSPDGGRIAYAAWEDQTTMRTHVFEIDSGHDRMLAGPTSMSHWSPIAWSPDGRSLLIDQNALEGPPGPTTAGARQLLLLAADGGGSARALGPAFPSAYETADWIRARFSPDGSSVFLVHAQDHLLWTFPTTGATSSTTPWPSEYLPAVQRLAP
jgi:WD40 repeat protein